MRIDPDDLPGYSELSTWERQVVQIRKVPADEAQLERVRDWKRRNREHTRAYDRAWRAKKKLLVQP